MKTRTMNPPQGDCVCELLDMAFIENAGGHDTLITVRVLEGPHAGRTVWTWRRSSDPDGAQQLLREWALLGIPARDHGEFEELKCLARGKRLVVRFVPDPAGLLRHHVLDVYGVDWPLEELHPDETEWLDANGLLAAVPLPMAC